MTVNLLGRIWILSLARTIYIWWCPDLVFYERSDPDLVNVWSGSAQCRILIWSISDPDRVNVGSGSELLVLNYQNWTISCFEFLSKQMMFQNHEDIIHSNWLIESTQFDISLVLIVGGRGIYFPTHGHIYEFFEGDYGLKFWHHHLVGRGGV